MTRSWRLQPPRLYILLLLAASAAAASTGSASPTACGPNDDAPTCAALLAFARAAHDASLVAAPGLGWRSGASYCTWPGVACALPTGSPFFSAVNASSPPLVVGLAFGVYGSGSLAANAAWPPAAADAIAALAPSLAVLVLNAGRPFAVSYAPGSTRASSMPFPDWMCRLTALQYLNADDLLLTGVLPSCMSGMASLRYLSVSGNALSGALDVSLGGPGSASLAYLDVSGNALAGLLPDSLLRLTTAAYNVSANPYYLHSISRPPYGYGFDFAAVSFDATFNGVFPTTTQAYPPGPAMPPPPPIGINYRFPPPAGSSWSPINTGPPSSTPGGPAPPVGSPGGLGGPPGGVSACTSCTDCPCPANPPSGYPFGNGYCAAGVVGASDFYCGPGGDQTMLKPSGTPLGDGYCANGGYSRYPCGSGRRRQLLNQGSTTTVRKPMRAVQALRVHNNAFAGSFPAASCSSWKAWLVSGAPPPAPPTPTPTGFNNASLWVGTPMPPPAPWAPQASSCAVSGCDYVCTRASAFPTAAFLLTDTSCWSAGCDGPLNTLGLAPSGCNAPLFFGWSTKCVLSPGQPETISTKRPGMSSLPSSSPHVWTPDVSTQVQISPYSLIAPTALTAIGVAHLLLGGSLLLLGAYHFAARGGRRPMAAHEAAFESVGVEASDDAAEEAKNDEDEEPPGKCVAAVTSAVVSASAAAKAAKERAMRVDIFVRLVSARPPALQLWGFVQGAVFMVLLVFTYGHALPVRMGGLACMGDNFEPWNSSAVVGGVRYGGGAVVLTKETELCNPEMAAYLSYCGVIPPVVKPDGTPLRSEPPACASCGSFRNFRLPGGEIVLGREQTMMLYGGLGTCDVHVIGERPCITRAEAPHEEVFLGLPALGVSDRCTYAAGVCAAQNDGNVAGCAIDYDIKIPVLVFFSATCYMQLCTIVQLLTVLFGARASTPAYHAALLRLPGAGAFAAMLLPAERLRAGLAYMEAEEEAMAAAPMMARLAGVVNGVWTRRARLRIWGVPAAVAAFRPENGGPALADLTVAQYVVLMLRLPFSAAASRAMRGAAPCLLVPFAMVVHAFAGLLCVACTAGTAIALAVSNFFWFADRDQALRYVDSLPGAALSGAFLAVATKVQPAAVLEMTTSVVELAFSVIADIKAAARWARRNSCGGGGKVKADGGEGESAAAPDKPLMPPSAYDVLDAMPPAHVRSLLLRAPVIALVFVCAGGFVAPLAAKDTLRVLMREREPEADEAAQEAPAETLGAPDAEALA